MDEDNDPLLPINYSPISIFIIAESIMINHSRDEIAEGESIPEEEFGVKVDLSTEF